MSRKYKGTAAHISSTDRCSSQPRYHVDVNREKAEKYPIRKMEAIKVLTTSVYKEDGTLYNVGEAIRKLADVERDQGFEGLLNFMELLKALM